MFLIQIRSSSFYLHCCKQEVGFLEMNESVKTISQYFRVEAALWQVCSKSAGVAIVITLRIVFITSLHKMDGDDPCTSSQTETEQDETEGENSPRTKIKRSSETSMPSGRQLVMFHRGKAEATLAINVAAARALQNMMRTNLGPKGTVKMLVSEAGDIRITKSGGLLLRSLRQQHPAASFIAQTVLSMNDRTGDGATSAVLLVGEMLKEAERYVSQGVHPRIIVEGLKAAKKEAIYCLDELWEDVDKSIMQKVARTSIGTKVCAELAEILAEPVATAVNSVSQSREPVDLKRVHLVAMGHELEQDVRLVNGVVLEQRGRHPDKKWRKEDAFVLAFNVALKQENRKHSSRYFYIDAGRKQRSAEAERRVIRENVRKIIALKWDVCGNSEKSFIVVNQKGIDPVALGEFASEGIVALWSVKKSDVEMLPLGCGGRVVSSLQDLSAECLGHAGLVYQETQGGSTYTFFEQCDDPRCVSLLIRDSNEHTLAQVKEAVLHGMRAVKNSVDDGSAMPGAGAVEIRIRNQLVHHRGTEMKGAALLGFQAFAEAILTIPKTLVENAGLDPYEVVSKALDAEEQTTIPVGIDLSSGELFQDWQTPVWDNCLVKHQLIHTSTAIVCNLLLVDGIVGTDKTLTPVDLTR
ncbi:T-complex protein 1 subunit zeta-like [Hypanus sabinus]|uniref:T-complex protein 1 subunit zeta-like n=1 Tax=Hypanus sabinus TaxID=79690 RepID=UPI0028C4297A|nr:T-complex protein 1 subunit zeta-like [Hypanus sabinus]